MGNVTHWPGRSMGVGALPINASSGGPEGEAVYAWMDVSADRYSSTSLRADTVPWLHTVTWAVRFCPSCALIGPVTAVTTRSCP